MAIPQEAAGIQPGLPHQGVNVVGWHAKESFSASLQEGGTRFFLAPFGGFSKPVEPLRCPQRIQPRIVLQGVGTPITTLDGLRKEPIRQVRLSELRCLPRQIKANFGLQDFRRLRGAQNLDSSGWIVFQIGLQRAHGGWHGCESIPSRPQKRRGFLLPAGTCECQRVQVQALTGSIPKQSSLEIEERKIGVSDARADVGVEFDCPAMRGKRGIQQSAVSAGVHQGCIEFWRIRVRFQRMQQTYCRRQGVSEIGLDGRVQAVRQDQVGVQRESPLKGALGRLLGSLTSLA